jgi:MarR family transcriptional regulator, lower aerobic nicotinate degradation pathway regulator
VTPGLQRSVPAEEAAADAGAYVLDGQVGFLLRQVSQRHTAIFASRMGSDITPTQWAALAKLHEAGPTSQNQLGRMTAMDVATIKGVVDRLLRRGLVVSTADEGDARRRLLALSGSGRAFVEAAFPVAARITAETLEPLSPGEARTLLALLDRLR